MKSKLFKTRTIGLDRKYVDSLTKITNLSEEVVLQITEWINQDFEIESRRLESYFFKERIENINNLCSSCEISEDDFFSIFSLATYIARRAYELDDSIEDIVDDFSSRKLIPEESKNKILLFFQLTNKKCTEIAKQSKRDEYEIKSIPILRAVDYSVRLILVPKKPFEPSSINVEEYRPEAEELVLSSAIELITVDGENANVVSFQLNFMELEDLVIKLQACQKEMRLMQTYQKAFKDIL